MYSVLFLILEWLLCALVCVNGYVCVCVPFLPYVSALAQSHEILRPKQKTQTLINLWYNLRFTLLIRLITTSLQ